MIYTEEDLEQAYAIGYNEAVDDVNAYIDQESMEFSLDESYDEDYSAVEAAIMNETSSANKKKHADAMEREINKYEKRDGSTGDYSMYLKYKKNDSDYDREHKRALNKAISDYRQRSKMNNYLRNTAKIHPRIQDKMIKQDELEYNQRFKK